MRSSCVNLEQILEAERLGLVDQPTHLHRPGQSLESLRKLGDLFLVLRELVIIVVMRDGIVRRELVAQFIQCLCRLEEQRLWPWAELRSAQQETKPAT